MKLKKSDILTIEMEITDICNLKCPLCIRENKPELIKNKIRSYEDVKSQLDEYKNLRNVNLTGILGEPTINRDLFEILEYLNSRNIKFHIDTNMDLYDEGYWYDLASLFKITDTICTSIAGIKQETHSKYRVGSSLDRILRHNYIFNRRFFTLHNCTLEEKSLFYIRFEYNKEETDEMIKEKFKEKFKECGIYSTSQFNETLYSRDDEYNMTKKTKNMYNKILSIYKDKPKEIICKSLKEKKLLIGASGEIYPCALYKYNIGDFNMEYKDILDFKYNFCKECDKNTNKMLEIIGLQERLN